MIKKWLGLDLFDLVVHIGVTIGLAVAIDSASTGPGGEGAIALLVTASLIVLGYRRQRATARRGTDAPSEPGRMEELEARMADLEAAQSRMLELEERVDFAERLLSQQREPVKLQKE